MNDRIELPGGRLVRGPPPPTKRRQPSPLQKECLSIFHSLLPISFIVIFSVLDSPKHLNLCFVMAFKQ